MYIMSKLIKKIIWKIYEIGKKESERQGVIGRKNYLNSLALIGSNTKVWEDAILQNGTGDRLKIKIGDNSWIRGYLLVFNHGGEIEIGDYSFIGPDTRIWSAKKIKIGNRVLISHNVNIHDNISHPLNSLKRHEDFKHIINQGLQKQNDLSEKEIVIEDDVWIGFNSTILKGVHIGKGAIIGACTLVTKDIPAYAVVTGNPMRIIKFVD